MKGQAQVHRFIPTLTAIGFGRTVSHDPLDVVMRTVERHASPFTAFASSKAKKDGDEDDDDGDGDDDESEKKFTKADVERMIKARLKKATKTIDDLTAKVDALSKKSDDDADDEPAGKGGDQSADLKRLEREMKRLSSQVAEVTKERDEALAKAGELTRKTRQSSAERTLSAALSKAGVSSKASDAALKLMLQSVEHDEDGDGFTVTIDGVPYASSDAKSLAKSASKFLETHSYFAEAKQGSGDGGRRDGGGRLPTQEDLDKMPVGSLLETGLQMDSPAKD